MKKRNFLKILLIFTICFFSIQPAFSVNSCLFFWSEDTTNADDYVKENIYQLLLGHNQDNVNLCDNLKVGSGIKVITEPEIEYYLYPIYENDSVKYVYRLYYDEDGYIVVLGEELVSHFNELMQLKKAENKLVLSNDNLLLICNDEIIPWAKDNISKKQYSYEEVNRLLSQRKNDIKKNIFTPLEFNQSNRSKIETRDVNFFLAIDYIDQQIDDSWCAGHVAANILRYETKNKNIYASHIAQFAGVEKNDGIPRSDVKQYAKAIAGISVKEYNGSSNLTASVIEGQMKLSQPIYGAFHRSKNSSSRHAIVIHGLYNKTVRVRNPWYTSSESYLVTNYAYVAANGSKWIQDGYMSFTK